MSSHTATSERTPLLQSGNGHAHGHDTSPSSVETIVDVDAHNHSPHDQKTDTFMTNFVFWFFESVLYIFFREIRIRGLQNFPKSGPVLVVAGPHSNQFIDAIFLWTHTPRRVRFLAAKKTMDRRGVGFAARTMQSIPVERPQDMIKSCPGLIHLPDPVNQPRFICGRGTSFTRDLKPRDSISLSGAGSAEVAEIISDTELHLREPFRNPSAVQMLTRTAPRSFGGSVEAPEVSTDESSSSWRETITRSYSTIFAGGMWSSSRPGANSVNLPVGTSWKRVPFVDQSELLQNVMRRLYEFEDVVGIFPEGGSHDRPEFLPLKAGAAVMALGAMAAHPDLAESGKPVRIVPAGINYFNPHRFRSRAVIEFGEALEVDPVLIRMYQRGGESKKVAVARLLEQIKTALKAVTVTAPSYEILTIIQVARRLFRSIDQRMSLIRNLYVTRGLMKGYLANMDDPQVEALAHSLADYDRWLTELGVKDHEVDTISTIGGGRALALLLSRLAALLFIVPLSLPGSILHLPMTIITEIISVQKARQALRESSVKIRGYDVLGTWKLLVATVLLPTFYAVYSAILFFLIYDRSTYSPVPDTYRLSLGYALLLSVFSLTLLLPAMGYATVRMNEVALDILRSLWPLVAAFVLPSKEIENLRRRREELKDSLAAVVRLYGPKATGIPSLAHFGLAPNDPRRQEIPAVAVDIEPSPLSPQIQFSGVGENDEVEEDDVLSSDEEFDVDDRLRAAISWVNATDRVPTPSTPISRTGMWQPTTTPTRSATGSYGPGSVPVSTPPSTQRPIIPSTPTTPVQTSSVRFSSSRTPSRFFNDDEEDEDEEGEEEGDEEAKAEMERMRRQLARRSTLSVRRASLRSGLFSANSSRPNSRAGSFSVQAGSFPPQGTNLEGHRGSPKVGASGSSASRT